MADVLNVKDFGARVDGVTNDSVALQNCVNAARSTGAICNMPGGLIFIGNTTIDLVPATPGFSYGPILQGTSNNVGAFGTGILYSGSGTAVRAYAGTPGVGGVGACTINDIPSNIQLIDLTVGFANVSPNGIAFDLCNANNVYFQNVSVGVPCSNDGTFQGIALGTAFRCQGCAIAWFDKLVFAGCAGPPIGWIRDGILLTGAPSLIVNNQTSVGAALFFNASEIFATHNAVHVMSVPNVIGNGNTIRFTNQHLDSVNVSYRFDNDYGGVNVANFVVQGTRQTHDTPHTENTAILADLTSPNTGGVLGGPIVMSLVFEETVAATSASGGVAVYAIPAANLVRSGTTVTGTFSSAALTVPTGLAVTNNTIGTFTTGTNNCYRVAAVSYNGQTAAATEICGGALAGCTGNNCGETISWSPVLGATSYQIFGRGTGAEVFIVQVPASYNSYADDGSQTPNGSLAAPTSDNGSGNACLLFAGNPDGNAAHNGGSKVYKTAGASDPNFPGGMKKIQTLTPTGCTLYEQFVHSNCAGYNAAVAPANRCTGFTYNDPTFNLLASASCTGTGATATCNTIAAHNFIVNSLVTVAGVTGGSYNGNQTVTAVPSLSSFQFSNTSTATGNGGTSTLAPATSTVNSQFTMGGYAISVASNNANSANGADIRIVFRNNEFAGWLGTLLDYSLDPQAPITTLLPFANYLTLTRERNRVEFPNSGTVSWPRRNFGTATLPVYGAGSGTGGATPPELPQNVRDIFISNVPANTHATIPGIVIIDDYLYPTRQTVQLSGGFGYLFVPHWQDRCTRCVDLTTPANTCTALDPSYVDLDWFGFGSFRGAVRVSGTGSDICECDCR